MSPVCQNISHSNQTEICQKNNDSIFKTGRNVALATVAGIATRWLGMPLEVVFVKRSFHDSTKSYRQLFRDHVFIWKEFRHFQTEMFTRTCLLQSVGKSFSNFGVIAFVEKKFPDLGSFQKGSLTIVLSTMLETITTTSGEWNKTLAIEKGFKKNLNTFKVYHVKNFLDSRYHRCLRATFIRSSWSTVFTYGGIYGLESCMKDLYPEKEHSKAVKVFSAVFGSMIPQLIIMPGVNLQTHVFRQPNLPWRESINQCLKDYKVKKVRDVYKLCKGFEVRSIHRGGTYGLAFLFAEMMKARD